MPPARTLLPRWTENTMTPSSTVLTYDDVRAVVGAVEEDVAAAIIALQPTHEDLIEAWAWASGDPEPLVAAGKTLGGKVAVIHDLLIADEDLGE